MSQSLAYEVMCFSELVRLDLLGCSYVWGWSVQIGQGRLRDEEDEDAGAFCGSTTGSGLLCGGVIVHWYIEDLALGVVLMGGSR